MSKGYLYAKGTAGNPLELSARIQGAGQTNITQAALSAITYRTWKYESQRDAERDSNGTEVSTSASLTISAVVHDTLQAWSADSTGYNFKFTLPGVRRPTDNTWTRVDITFDPAASGQENYVVTWIIENLAVGG